ncbi:MAG: plasmid stabilization protein [Flavobacterium sp. BFFFF2]|nr:MAG: plasmid stabilization protein [Flavobacterium sp. BFFFF2]
MYQFELSATAKEDFLRIYEYGIGKFGINQADKYFNMMHDCFSKIASNPYLFPEATRFKAGYRYCVCGVDTIFYKINTNQIEIMAIIGKQDFP